MWHLTWRRSVPGWTIRRVADFGRNLRAARKLRKWSQEELADYSGIQAAEISRIETGKRDPQVSTLLRLAEALEIHPGQLLE